MTNENKRRGVVRKLQDFMATYSGKVIQNYAYSWGAAIVILGALFKLTHLPGANTMLFVGMGTEVLVFFFSAFDRPYKSYKWESVFPHIKVSGDNQERKEEDKNNSEQTTPSLEELLRPIQPMGGTIIVGGSMPTGSLQTASQSSGQPLDQPVKNPATQSMANASTANVPLQGFVGTPVIQAPAAPVTPGVEVSPEMEDATKQYLEQLKEMTDALSRFVEQTKSMGQDADQINTLNKNLSGINAIYEIQLRSIGSQLGTLDEINEQTRKMARQIDELNTVYARMLEAMTVNMKINGTTNV